MDLKYLLSNEVLDFIVTLLVNNKLTWQNKKWFPEVKHASA